MMDELTLRKALTNIPLGGLRYFEQTGSTNDDALAWAVDGAPDLALVYAEQQTAGRGRGSRSWFTPPGSALAFSLILHPLFGQEQSIPLYSALGALSVCEVLAAQGLHPEIKWPNDVLLKGRKVCGILAESVWLGEHVECIVLGVGMNVTPRAVPPPEHLNFPATCLEAEMNPHQREMQPVVRELLLQQILHAALYWRGLVASPIFLESWENRLAYRGQMVEIWVEEKITAKGWVQGLAQDGSLRLLSPQGQTLAIKFGEVHLRSVV